MNPWLLTIIPCIIAFYLMKKEKEGFTKDKPNQSPLSGNLLWYVLILEFLSPLIGQTIFYYGWKKVLPVKAKKANSLGWIVIAVWVVGRIVLNSVLK